MNRIELFIQNYIAVPYAYAQPGNIGELMARVNEYVLNPIITLMFIVAFVIFVWGLFSFFQAKGGSGSDEDIQKGKRHIFWGIIGMVIMTSVFGIMQLLINSLGVQGIQPNSSDIGDLSVE
jgi:Na+/serine symporter